MTIDEAKEQIKKLEEYIKMIEAYIPETFEQHAIKLYVLHEHVANVATMLNGQGFRIGKRKVIGMDVSDILRAKPSDELHELAVKLFKQNKKKVKGR
jgi:hypothetical protein